MSARLARWTAPLFATCAIAALAGALYGPYLGNPRMFDDWTFFSGQQFAFYATHPFGLALRLPPHFSLAVTEVLVGGMAAHRLVNLAVHIAAALALYALVFQVLRAATGRRGSQFAIAPTDPALQGRLHAAALAAAALFAVHPVAVYGAGYLMQRTILFATLFSLLSVALFVRGLRRGNHADALSAGLFFSVAVLSKEHALLLPAVALLAMPLVAAERRFALRHAAIYLAVCAPAAILVVLLSIWLVGRPYEPNFAMIAAEIETGAGRGLRDFPWGLSAVTQAGLFFKYLFLWLWPDSRAMSIDLRVDFFATWSPAWIVLKVGAFAAFGVLGVLMLLRRGRTAVAGFGLLWMWTLYLIELSTARFQEPFVLYRSYLWAPGLVTALAVPLTTVPPRAVLAALAVAGALVFQQAHDRLGSMSSLLRAWEDAVAKLPASPVPGGARTLYNLAREYVYAGRSADALEVARRCTAQYADAFHCHTTHGMIHHEKKDFAQALPYLVRAAELNSTEGVTHFRVGVVLESLGRTGDAEARYRRAAELGYGGARLSLKRIESAASPAAASGERERDARSTRADDAVPTRPAP